MRTDKIIVNLTQKILRNLLKLLKKNTVLETISIINDLLTEERKLLRWFTLKLDGKQFSLF
jgi:hypothetical protein